MKKFREFINEGKEEHFAHAKEIVGKHTAGEKVHTDQTDDNPAYKYSKSNSHTVMIHKDKVAGLHSDLESAGFSKKATKQHVTFKKGATEVQIGAHAKSSATGDHGNTHHYVGVLKYGKKFEG